MVQVGVGELVQKGGVMDTVERFGEIDCYGSCSERRFRVVEAASYGGCQRD